MNERLVETSRALKYYSIACISNITQFTKEGLYQIVLLLIIYENKPHVLLGGHRAQFWQTR